MIKCLIPIAIVGAVIGGGFAVFGQHLLLGALLSSLWGCVAMTFCIEMGWYDD